MAIYAITVVITTFQKIWKNVFLISKIIIFGQKNTGLLVVTNNLLKWCQKTAYQPTRNSRIWDLSCKVYSLKKIQEKQHSLGDPVVDNHYSLFSLPSLPVVILVCLLVILD